MRLEGSDFYSGVNKINGQSNLLGTIIELPKIVQSLSDQFKANELRIQKQKEGSFDPLNIEGA